MSEMLDNVLSRICDITGINEKEKRSEVAKQIMRAFRCGQMHMRNEIMFAMPSLANEQTEIHFVDKVTMNQVDAILGVRYNPRETNAFNMGVMQAYESIMNIEV